MLWPPISTLTAKPFPYMTLFRTPHRRSGFRDHRRVRGRTSTPSIALGLHRVGGARRRSPRRRAADGRGDVVPVQRRHVRSEEHTSELQSLLRNTYAVFCMKKKTLRQHNSLDNYNNYQL